MTCDKRRSKLTPNVIIGSFWILILVSYNVEAKIKLQGAMDLIDAAQLQGARNTGKHVKPASVGAIWVTLFITLTLTLGLGVYMTLALRGSCACRILERCSAVSDVAVGATLSTAQGIPCPELPRTCPEAPGSYQGRGGVSRSSRDIPMNHPSSSPWSRMRLCDNATTRDYPADDAIGYESSVERRNSSLTLMETTRLIDSIFPDGFGSQNTPDNNNATNPLYDTPRTRESLFSREATLLSAKPGTPTAERTEKEIEEGIINEGEGEHLYEDMEAVRPSAFVPTGIHDDDTIIFKKAPRHASPRKVRRVTFTLGETAGKE